MRIFIGIPFSEETKKELKKVQKKVTEKSATGRFADWDNFHLTIKFIGEIDEGKLPEIKEVVERVTREERPFTLVLQGFDAFRKGSTCIPWLGVGEGKETLEKLQENMETALEEIGYPKESRPFRPHMTFGRKVQLSLSDQSALQEALSRVKIRIEVTSVAIMESTRKNGKLVYPIVKEFPLK